MNPRVFIRTDGNETIGLGHVYRCLALSQMLATDFECCLVVKENPVLVSIIQLHNIFIRLIRADIPEDEEIQLLQEMIPQRSDILVLDGYQFEAPYQSACKEAGIKVVVIDDLCRDRFFADLLINHGGELLRSSYEEKTQAKLLLGFDYLMLRQEFFSRQLTKSIDSEVGVVFICFGGADPFRVTTKAIRAAFRSGFIQRVIVVAGAAYQDWNSLNELKADLKEKLEVHKSVTAEQMVKLIAGAQLAICPASSISLEVCSVGTGLLTGTVIDNQNAIHLQLLGKGCAVSAGDFREINEDQLASCIRDIFERNLIGSMKKKQLKVVDGLSGHRLVKEFQILSES